MSEIQNSIFKIHHTAAARYANNPSFLNPTIWIQMVDKWLKDEWQKESKKNAINRGKSTIVHTTDSVLMEKYMKEEVDRAGVEPSPIEMFKKFHISKTKEATEEHWPNDTTKYFYELMVDQKAADKILGDKGEDLSDWDIYKEVIGKPSRGLGASMKPSGDDYPSSSQNCNKFRCLDRENEFKQLKDEGDTTTNLDEVPKELSAQD